MSTIRGIENKHDRALIHDDFNAELLLQILTELKKITLHLELLNDEEIRDGDLKDGSD